MKRKKSNVINSEIIINKTEVLFEVKTSLFIILFFTTRDIIRPI